MRICRLGRQRVLRSGSFWGAVPPKRSSRHDLGRPPTRTRTATMPRRSTVIGRLQTERAQGHSTRRSLFADLSRDLGRPVVTYFTSFRHPVAMSDEDVETLEDILRTLDLSNGMAIMISSPGAQDSPPNG